MNLSSIAKVFIICFGLLETVSSIPTPHNGSDGRVYLIETEQKYNWYQAWHECARTNYRPVTIESDNKNTIVINLLKKIKVHSEDLWIGGHDQFNIYPEENRPFVWMPTGRTMAYSFWSTVNPDNHGHKENCVHIWVSADYQWNDADCTKKLGFICEINPKN